MKRRKIVFVGKLYNSKKSNGPSAVLDSLIKAFNSINEPIEEILLTEEQSSTKFLFKLMSLLFKRDCIVNVHADGFFICAITLLISKLSRKNKFFLTVHGIYAIQIKYFNCTDNIKLYTLLEKMCYTYFPNLICVSEYCKEKLLSIYSPKGDIYVVDNGIEYPKSAYFEKNKLDKSFMFLGGFQEVKGIKQLMAVFGELIEMNSDIRLDIYGSSNEEIELWFNNFVKENNLSRNIKYNGMLRTKQDVIKEFYNHSYHIAMSKIDTFNVAILEAMNSGCINITNSNSGAAHYISNDISGYVFSGDIENAAIVESIQHILDEMTLQKYHEIVKNAKTRIEKCSWNDVANRYLDIFNM